MVEKQSNQLEREFVVPLRDKCRPVPRYKKTPKAVKSLKEFIARHMKIRDRDLKKIKIDLHLNELLWQRGIKKPLHKVKVKAIKEGDIVRVYATDLTAKIKFKKARLERKDAEAIVAAEKQKSMMEKAKESMQGNNSKDKKDNSTTELKDKDKDKDGVDDKVEEKEKSKAVEETERKESKSEHKEIKHTTPTKKTGEQKDKVSQK